MYVELHCKTNFSFLEGASHADELVRRAAELGYAGLAITDRHSLAGVVRAHVAGRESGMPLIYGAEVTLQDSLPVVLWATDRASYGRLCRLLTVGRRRAVKGDCLLGWEDLAAHAEGLLGGVLPPPLDRQRSGGAGDQASLGLLRQYRELLGNRAYLLAEMHRGPDDSGWLQWLQHLSRSCRLPLVAAGNVHYHVPRRAVLQDVLTAIRHGRTVDEAQEFLWPNADRYLHPPRHLRQRYRRLPEAVARTVEIADRCHFSLAELRYEYPRELAPADLTPMQYLRKLTWRGAQRRYPEGVPQKVQGLLEHELSLIAELKYEAYFLTVWDLVRYARSRNILCQGRGSAANSAVCYCLGVTAVDPQTTDLLFERFVSRERDEAPDIDVDFEHERREEVLQYLYDKYGRDRAGLTAVVVTYRLRSAIRDVGKALSLSLDRVDALAKQVEGHTEEPRLPQRCREVGFDPESPVGKRFLYLVQTLTGFPRHLSQHVGGMVITQGPLCELTPIENAAMPDRTVIQWAKDDLEELGILKVDCLALGMLTAIHKCFDLIRGYHGQQLDMSRIPAGDSHVYDMICRADTMGVFQIESRAQMCMLPRLRPQCYYDLVIEVAIVRPGPIQGQMVHPYLRRRAGREQVSYPNEEVRQVLHRTLGVPIFQEQAMRLAVVAAGFTPGEADQLRRAMGAWRRPGVIDQFRRKLVEGMRQRGLSPEFAQQVFQQIRGFGEYGFPESHAASFALLVYISAWLKHYYQAAFTAALINSQPMGFYGISQLVRDARDKGVTVLPVDVNASHWDCTLTEPPDQDPGPVARPPACLQLGFRVLHGFPQRGAERICRARTRVGPFVSLEHLQQQTGLNQPQLVRLADADALQTLTTNRRQALWTALGQPDVGGELPLFAAAPESLENPSDRAVQLPALSLQEEVFEDYRSSGLSLKAHPVAFFRPQLEQMKVVTAQSLPQMPANRAVRVAGLVLLRQRPSTAKGITFVTLEDETGTINLVVKQPVWQRYYAVARRCPAWLVGGQLQRQDGVIHVVAQFLEDLSIRLQCPPTSSRDFR